jgi:hypothetical protein
VADSLGVVVEAAGRGIVGKAKANFKGLSVDGGGWWQGRKAEEDKCEKEGEERGGDGG